MPFCSSSADFKHRIYKDTCWWATEIQSIHSVLWQLRQAEFFLPLIVCVLYTLLWGPPQRANLITFLLLHSSCYYFKWPRFSNPVLPMHGKTNSAKGGLSLSYTTVLLLSCKWFLLKLATRLTVSLQPAVLVSASQLDAWERTTMNLW